MTTSIAYDCLCEEASANVSERMSPNDPDYDRMVEQEEERLCLLYNIFE